MLRCWFGIVGVSNVAAAVFVSVSLAADLVPLKAPLPPPPVVYSWTGCYTGYQVGGVAVGGSGAPFGVGAVGGVQLGCNYQNDWGVVGLEAEAVWSGLAANNTSNTVKNHWDADIAARLGRLIRPDVLGYLKIGAAFADFSYSQTSSVVVFNPSTFNFDTIQTTSTGKATMVGLLLGAGLEYMMTPHLFARSEFDVVVYNPKNIILVCQPADICVSPTSTMTALEVQFFARVGLSYRFL